MDPDLLAARNRYKGLKPQPSSEQSDFQKKLANNPYARALATPVRNCAVTGVRLPNYFLLNFGLTPHPATGKPWQMPTLTVDPNTTTSSNTAGPERNLGQATVTPNQKDEIRNSTFSPERTPARAVAGSYIVSQSTALKFMSNVRRRSYMQMLPQKWKLDTRFNAEDIVWREDMDVFVGNLMRKKAVRLLRYLSRQPAAYLAGCEDYQSIQNKHQPGATLWLGNRGNSKIPSVDGQPPPPYAIVKYRSARPLPLYNLPALLGPEYFNQLCESSELFNSSLVVIKQKRNTIDTLMHMWKLMGYMASGADAVPDAT
ncbi:MAG: hypothetical protein Q9219_002739 [cf. Caloplaca sp. 3 TL-2023]